MSLISINNLTFGYEGSLENVFENISINIDTDWKLGLIGRNGKGKTTFLKLLLGDYSYSGTISKNVTFDYFPYEIKDKNKMAIEIINEKAPDIEDWEIIKELNFLHTNPEILYRDFSTLSGGEQVKIQLVSLFLKGDNFLLIDEPTNHLDIQTKNNLVEYLKKKKGFILVSHDRNFLDEVIDHIISINNTNIDIQKGNFSSWQENKDRQNKFELTQNEKITKDISRLEVAAKSTSKWSHLTEKSKYKTSESEAMIDRGFVGHKSAKMMKRSKVIEQRIEKAIEDKSSLLKNIDRNDSLKIVPVFSKKDVIVTAKDLQIEYDNKAIFSKVSFEVKNGDRVAIIGKNGAGKSSILKLILGEKTKFTGDFNAANEIKISYVSQNTDSLKGSLKEYAKKFKVDEGVFKAMLSKMGFDTTDLEKDIAKMSEGQKKKVLIARSISESANLYIWDEPLNYIDILTRIQIEECIQKYRPTIIFVEHDETFIKNIATKIVHVKT